MSKIVVNNILQQFRAFVLISIENFMGIIPFIVGYSFFVIWTRIAS